AVSPLAVEVGQEATMYAWSMFLATLALAAGLAWLRSGCGVGWYVLAATLLLYTHYMGAPLLAGLLLGGLLWQTWPQSWGQPPAVTRRSWLLAHTAIGLLWAPWLAAMGVRLAQRWDELSH